MKFDGMWLTRKSILNIFDISKAGIFIRGYHEKQLIMQHHLGIFNSFPGEGKLDENVELDAIWLLWKILGYTSFLYASNIIFILWPKPVDA